MSLPTSSCILSKFYIKPQQAGQICLHLRGCILSKFYIKPQLCGSSPFGQNVVSYRNSTSNHNHSGFRRCGTRVVSYRNSTSNHNYLLPALLRQVVVSYRNSTSNHNIAGPIWFATQVVSYRNSTSNHNNKTLDSKPTRVVSYRNSTSNHNVGVGSIVVHELYLIEILHQTTTICRQPFCAKCCILSKFYIKPQQLTGVKCFYLGCILSKFYIKPQLFSVPCWGVQVVSYRNSTSNHNYPPVRPCFFDVVSYRNSTSNHNVGPHID